MGIFEGFIYIIENIINDKVYIGQTVDPERRKRQHFRKTNYGCPLLRNAIDRHGAGNFCFVIVEKCLSQEELNEREMHWIKALNSLRPHGYNLSDGGTGGNRIFLGEHRKNLSVSKLGKNNPNFGKPETILNIKWMSGLGEHPFFGKHLSDLHRNKISTTLSNKKYCKRGHMFTKENTLVVGRKKQRLCRVCHNMRSRNFYHRRQN